MHRLFAGDIDLEMRIGRHDDGVDRACLAHLVAQANTRAPRENDEYLFACNLVRRGGMAGRKLDAPYARVG